jgi:hypothetical protein
MTKFNRAIETKYLPWTETKPGRIVARDAYHTHYSLTVSDADSHLEVAERLARKLLYGPLLASAETKTGYVFIFYGFSV